MRSITTLLALGLLGFAGLALAQTPPPAAANDLAPPAAAGSVAAPAQPSLEDIRNFTRVYEVIRKAYVKPIDNATLMKSAITGMLAKLDPHSAWLDREGIKELKESTSGKYSGLGVVVTSMNGKLTVIAPIDDSPAAKAGLASGDVIISIDGAPVRPDNVQASIEKLRGEAGTKITLVLLHGDNTAPITKTLTRAMIATTSVRVRTLEPGYAYVRISQFQANTASDLEHKLGQWIDKHGSPKGLVLDLRSNPGGLVKAAVGAADAFLDGGQIVSTRGRVKDSNMHFQAHAGDMLHGAPMVVLVNQGTASAAEILSGALKDNHRALIMGRRTFGKGVVQTIIPIDKNHLLKLTTARYFTPNGTSIQAEGIVPDIAIPELMVSQGDHPPSLIGSESDLPHHLGNHDPKSVKASIKASRDALHDSAKLAEDDYALAQAMNVLKGMVMAR